MDITKPSEISSETWLSPREAEFFVKYFVEGKSLTEAAEEMEVSPGTSHSTLGRVKEKRRKSENTLNLFEEVENRE